MKVLVTGASGFIGSAMLPILAQRGCEVLACSRTPVRSESVQWYPSPELSRDADWSAILRGVDVVVHLAGRAHVVSERSGSEVSAMYQSINVEGTRTLARQGADAGVRHFVFMSSCHAVAAESQKLLTEKTAPHPTSIYGKSKLAAERALACELEGSGCAWTILRPPLVYGPRNRANFGRLVRLVRSGIPLPLGGIRNRRSFVSVDNLADMVSFAVGNPSAFNRVFFPSDNADVSTPELVRKLAGAIGRPARVFCLPGPLFAMVAALPHGAAFAKLTSSLFVDCTPILVELGWSPKFSLEEGLRGIA